MKNTYMTPLTYTNFDGVKKTTKLHFHLTPREFADWMIDHMDEADAMLATFSNIQEEIEANPNSLATKAQTYSMLRLVRLLAELSYGVPMDDGEVFDKSGLNKFVHSAAYDGFRMFLFENANELMTFIQTLLSEDVVNEFSSRMAAVAQSDENEAPAQLTSVTNNEKDPKEMTREELLAAMKDRNTQQ